MPETQITSICQRCNRPFQHLNRGRNQPRKFCSYLCYRTHRIKPLAARLLARCTWHPSPEKCWEWQGAKNKQGYGQIFDVEHGSQIATHRASWKVHFGAIPNGMNVLHRCDIPACVNPAHLFLGTQKDNALDMVAKGRDEQGGRKLEPEMILAIRRSPLKQAELARQFFVSRVTISDIRRRKSWKHLS